MKLADRIDFLWTCGFALLLVVALAPAAVAGPDDPAPAAPEATAASAPDDEKPEMTPEEARQARIEEYLRKREEKRVAKEKKAYEKEVARQDEKARKAAAEAEAQAAKEQAMIDEQAAEHQRELDAAAAGGTLKESGLPKSLAQVQADVRSSRLGQDPTVIKYLDLVDSQQATPQQLAALGNFIADAGAINAAVEYYNAALQMDKEDPVLWINLGTLQRKLDRPSDAASSYGKAIQLDRTNAVAHYNYGATMDMQGKYKKALESYRLALTLDPSLADPAVNPQAANNERLLAVKMLIYKEQIGNLGMPLVEIPEGALDEEQ